MGVGVGRARHWLRAAWPVEPNHKQSRPQGSQGRGQYRPGVAALPATVRVREHGTPGTRAAMLQCHPPSREVQKMEPISRPSTPDVDLRAPAAQFCWPAGPAGVCALLGAATACCAAGAPVPASVAGAGAAARACQRFHWIAEGIVDGLAAKPTAIELRACLARGKR